MKARSLIAGALVAAAGASAGYFARPYLDSHFLNAQEDPFLIQEAKPDPDPPPPYVLAGRTLFQPASGRCWFLATEPEVQWVEIAATPLFSK